MAVSNAQGRTGQVPRHAGPVSGSDAAALD